MISLKVHDLRDFSENKNRAVDDMAYGGGGGMVFAPQPLFSAIKSIKQAESHVVLLSPSGKQFNHKKASELSKHKHLILVCGRYEGVDQRAIDLTVNEEISVGDFVLTGGEIPAMLLIEAVSRFVPGVVGNAESPKNESFVNNILEHPHYTRPAKFQGLEVPSVLRSGDHKKIEEWRKSEAIKKTQVTRPDLLSRDHND